MGMTFGGSAMGASLAPTRAPPQGPASTPIASLPVNHASGLPALPPPPAHSLANDPLSVPLSPSGAGMQQLVHAPSPPVASASSAPTLPYVAASLAAQQQHQQQQAAAAAYYAAYYQQQRAAAAGPSYLQVLWERRKDVVRLCLLSLIVLLAISTHSTILHYLRGYVEARGGLISEGKELALRCAYPILVLLVLWHVKAFALG